MSQNFIATDICTVCNEQLGDHSAAQLSCPNPRKYESGQPWYANTVFTKERAFPTDHVEHTNS